METVFEDRAPARRRNRVKLAFGMSNPTTAPEAEQATLRNIEPPARGRVPSRLAFGMSSSSGRPRWIGSSRMPSPWAGRDGAVLVEGRAPARGRDGPCLIEGRAPARGRGSGLGLPPFVRWSPRASDSGRWVDLGSSPSAGTRPKLCLIQPRRGAQTKRTGLPNTELHRGAGGGRSR